MTQYRDNPKDITYNKSISIYALLFESISHYSKLIFCGIKAVTYDVLVQVFQMVLCGIELFLNKSRQRIGDPDGIRDKAQLRYAEKNADRCTIFVVPMVICYILCVGTASFFFLGLCSPSSRDLVSGIIIVAALAGTFGAGLFGSIISTMDEKIKKSIATKKQAALREARYNIIDEHK